MKKAEQDFQEIGQELEQDIERRLLEDKIPLFLRKKTVSVVALSLIGFLGLKAIIPQKLVFKNVEELPAKSQSDYDYSWTEEAFTALKEDPTGSNADTINSILERFGRPSSSKEIDLGDENGIELTYDKGTFTGKPNQEVVTLIFNSNSEPVLFSKDFYGMPILPYTATTTEGHRWTKAEFQVLKVGSVTGKGGENLDVILDKYGEPISYETFGFNDERTLRLRYIDKTNSDGVYLLFKKDNDSQGFQLSDKEWFE